MKMLESRIHHLSKTDVYIENYFKFLFSPKFVPIFKISMVEEGNFNILFSMLPQKYTA